MKHEEGGLVKCDNSLMRAQDSMKHCDLIDITHVIFFLSPKGVTFFVGTTQVAQCKASFKKRVTFDY